MTTTTEDTRAEVFAETALPRVSLVTVFYNRAPYVAESVGSLLAQTYQNLEIIAVDDGSTDDTLKELQRLDDPRLTVVAKENTGFTRSLRDAIEAADGEYIAIHDAGDVSYADRIAKQAGLMRERPDIGVVGCLVGQESVYDGNVRTIGETSTEPFSEVILERNIFTHGEVMFRRSVYDVVGGYRPFFYFAQDRDLWIRMSQHTNYAIVPEVLYLQKLFEGGVSTSPDKKIMQAFLSDFAAQCGRTRDANGRDLLDQFGVHAVFFRARSSSLSKRLLGVGVRWMLRNDLEEGKRFIDVAHNEHPSVGTYAARLLYVLAKPPPLRNALSKALAGAAATRRRLT